MDMPVPFMPWRSPARGKPASGAQAPVHCSVFHAGAPLHGRVHAPFPTRQVGNTRTRTSPPTAAGQTSPGPWRAPARSTTRATRARRAAARATATTPAGSTPSRCPPRPPVTDYRSATHEWRPARFRLLFCTYDARPCGPLVRADEMTKSKNDPRPYFFWITTPVTVYAAGCGALVHPRLARAFDKVEIIPVSNYDRQIRFRRVKRRKRGRRLRDLQRGWRRRRCQRCGGGQSGRGVCLMGVPHDRSLGGSTASSPARPPAQTGSGSSLSDTPV